MKTLLLFLCACVVTLGNPIGDLGLSSQGSDTTTDSGTTSPSPGTPMTVVPIISSQETTAMPVSSETTAVPVSFVTVSPGSETSESPFSSETTMSSKGTTMSPITVSIHSVKTPSTTQATPTPKPQKGGGFDGGSFAGGIALGAGIALILYVAYRIYASRKTSGYSTM